MSGENKEADKILRFDEALSASTAESSKKYPSTAKYNRQALNKRLTLEEWMHYELRRLFGCQDEEEYRVEIDVDILVHQDNNDKRTEMLEKVLASAKLPVQEFINELLIRIQNLDSNNPSGKFISTKEMEF